MAIGRSTRREFALLSMAAASLSTASAAEGIQVDSVTATKNQELDPVAWTKERYRTAPLKMTFRAGTKAEAEEWQRVLREKLTELLGGFPERVPLQARTLGVQEYADYRREEFLFETRPGVSAVGYLLTPKQEKPPFRVVISIPGHGLGARDIVGLDGEGRERTGDAGYEHDFAIQAVRQGAAAFALEPMGFGQRRDPLAVAKGTHESSCQPAAGSALLFGETMIGWRVWDVMRTIDWIGTRKELDAARIGCMGISGGGTCTLFASALDLRIKAAFVSGYMNTFRDSIMSVSHCIDNYVPGILNWAENYDVAGLIAPRPLFSEGGDRDPIFPVSATRECYARVKKVYEVFGVPQHVEQEIFEGEHVFHGSKGLPFLVSAL